MTGIQEEQGIGRRSHGEREERWSETSVPRGSWERQRQEKMRDRMIDKIILFLILDYLVLLIPPQ